MNNNVVEEIVSLAKKNIYNATFILIPFLNSAMKKDRPVDGNFVADETFL